MLSEKLLAQLTDREHSVQGLAAIRQKVLATSDDLDNLFPKNWLIDIAADEAKVGGDFIFVKSRNDRNIVAVVDSVGHSLTGMTASLSIHLLLSLGVENGLTDPADIIQFMHEKASLHLKNEITCDLGILKWNPLTNIVDYAGAKRAAHYTRPSGIYVLEPSRISIGQERKKSFDIHSHRVEMEEGDRIFIATDGAETQPNGINMKILKRTGFQRWLKDTSRFEMPKQKEALIELIHGWVNQKSVTDDILILGIEF